MIKLPALALLALALVSSAPRASAQEVTGAGSTFAHPILSRWSRDFQRAQSDAEFQPVGIGLDYEPIGSQAGIMRLSEAAVDFGASDVPLGTDELARYGAGQFPFVIGGIVAAYNIDGIKSGALKLSGEVLAEIYLGRITNWSDPALKALNPDLALPVAPITAIRRTDGSGTTFNFANFLSNSSAQWKAQIGEGLVLAWPVGIGAKGNEGVAEAIKARRNVIGYVDYAQARRAGLSYAALRNRDGRFVLPSPDSFQAAAAGADWTARPDFALLLTDTPGEASYPLVAATFAVMRKQSTPSKRTLAAFGFFRWSFDNGTAAASELGYVPLPGKLAAEVKQYWATRFNVER